MSVWTKCEYEREGENGEKREGLGTSTRTKGKSGEQRQGSKEQNRKPAHLLVLTTPRREPDVRAHGSVYGFDLDFCSLGLGFGGLLSFRFGFGLGDGFCWSRF